MSVVERIDSYLANGGLWNPELANHDVVRDLLIDCRTELTTIREELASQYAFVVLSASTLGAARNSVERIIKRTTK